MASTPKFTQPVSALTAVLLTAFLLSPTLPPDQLPDQTNHSPPPPASPSQPNQPISPAPSSLSPQTTPPAASSVLPDAEPTHPNYPYFAQLTPNDPLYGQQWHLNKIGGPATWDVSTGAADVTIAVIDTGFALNHQDLATAWATNPGEMGSTALEGPAPNCTSRGLSLDKSCNNRDNDGNGYKSDWRGYDFVNDDNNPMAGSSGGAVYHGTMVAGFAAARGNNGTGLAGVNWGAKVLPLQVLDDGGSGFTDEVAAAVRYAADRGAKVINLSLGSVYNDDYLRQQVNYALGLGVTVVAAAGNSGGSMVYPANWSEVVSVGATDSNDNLASFSSYGPNLFMVAPGANICSTSYSNSNQTAAYACGSGTSYASPLVAGVVSLLYNRFNTARPDEIKKWLIDGVGWVSGMGDQKRTDRYGSGLISSYQSLMAASIPLPAGQLLSKTAADLSETGDLTAGPSLASSCQGPAGASCNIRLTKGATVKTLGAKTLDDYGGAVWYWSAADQNLSSGQWLVEAVLTANGQTQVYSQAYLEISL